MEWDIHNFMFNDEWRTEKGLFFYIDVDKNHIWIDADGKITDKLQTVIDMQNCFTTIYLSGSTGVTREKINLLAKVLTNAGYPKEKLGSFIPNHLQISEAVNYLFLPKLLNSTIDYYRYEYYDQVRKIALTKNIDLVPIAYILVEPANQKTVGKVTKPDIISREDITKLIKYVKLAETEGFNAIYIDAGSGAERPMNTEMVRACREVFDGRIMIGGGIRESSQIKDLLEAGGDIIVIGNCFEKSENLNQTLSNFWEPFLHYNQLNQVIIK